MPASVGQQTCHGRLAFVVAHESVDGREIKGCDDVDRVEGSKRWFFDGSCGGEHGPVERKQRDRVEQLSSASKSQVEWKPGLVRRRAAYCARYFGKGELRRDEIGSRDEGT